MEQATCKVTEFHNTEFGAIRVIEDQGRLLFCGTDVAFALGYSKPALQGSPEKGRPYSWWSTNDDIYS